MVILALINNSMNRLNYITAPFAHAVLYINLFTGVGVSTNSLPVTNVLRLMSDGYTYES